MRVQDLTGAQLDRAVAKAKGTLGQKPARCFDCKYYEERQGRYDAIQYCHHPKMDFEDGSGALRTWPSDNETHEQCPINPLTAEPFSTDWSLAGPIIERERISIRQWTNVPIVHAYMPQDDAPWASDGTSPLIAAMRCYVASKLGDEINIPEELK